MHRRPLNKRLLLLPMRKCTAFLATPCPNPRALQRDGPCHCSQEEAHGKAMRASMEKKKGTSTLNGAASQQGRCNRAARH